MRADNRYKVALWHEAFGIAKIETFYGGTNIEGIPPPQLENIAHTLYEKNGWEVVGVKYDGSSMDFNKF